MSPKKPSVRFGTPVPDIPEPLIPNGHGGAEHWQQVADHCTANPSVWHPVTIGHLTADRHRQVVSGINGNTTAQLLAFRDGGYRAAFREGQLYVRFDPAAEVSPIRRKRATA